MLAWVLSTTRSGSRACQTFASRLRCSCYLSPWSRERHKLCGCAGQRGVERQQIKWFAYAAAAAASGGLLRYVVPVTLGVPWLELVGFVPMVVGAVSVPVSMGIAILRYRLYEIDLIINRTLVYGSLTVALALVYFGGVATTQTAFRALTGQEEQPQLAIVVSTLVIAALFNPLRRRIQSFIDRTFYRRRKYAARK